MAQKSQSVPAAVSASILSLIIGGVIGFYTQSFLAKPSTASPAGAPGGMRPGAGGAPGGGMGFGGGRGFGGSPSPAADLARLVRNLDTVEKVQGAALTPAQSAALAPILTKIQSASTLSDTDAQSDSDAIQKILTPAQQSALTALTPQRAARGGGGGQQNPNQPFASDRNKQALDSLIAETHKA